MRKRCAVARFLSLLTLGQYQVLLFLIFQLAQALLLQGQDLKKVLPETLPNQAPVNSLEPETQKAASPQDQQIVASLKGIVFLSRPDEFKVHGYPVTSGVNVEKFPILDTPQFRDKMLAMIGKPLKLSQLDYITKLVIQAYTQADRPVVDAVVPEQDIDNGVLQIVVIEGRVHVVKIRGNKYFSSEVLASEFVGHQGDYISEKAMLENLNWMNQNPFREVNAEFARGSEVGATDIVLRVKDRFPIRTYTGYDNSGNSLTGFDRWHNGINWGNAFGLDQQLNYQFTSDNQYTRFLAHAGSYIVPLPWHHTLSIYGGYIATQAKNSLADDTRLHGAAWQISARYTIPLEIIQKYQQNLTFGYDYKQTNNNFDFGGTFDFGANGVISSTTDISQWMTGYNCSYEDPLGTTELDLSIFLSPGGATGNNRTSSFQASRDGARANYAYGQVALSRTLLLPENFSLFLKGTYQDSSTNLLPSEQLGLGGSDTIRGYQEHTVNGDVGWILNGELRFPTIKVIGWLGPKSGKNIFDDKLQFLGFVDYGWTRNNTLLPGESSDTYLWGVGPGLRYTIGPNVSVKFDYGFQLINPNLGDSDRSRGHLFVNIAF